MAAVPSVKAERSAVRPPRSGPVRATSAITPARSADEVGPPADLLRRLAARLADAGTVFSVLWAMVVLRVFWFIPGYAGDLDPQPWGRAFLPTASFAVLYTVYEVVFLRWNKGQTPGRDWMKVRVVAADGRDPRVLTALRRALVPAILVMVPPLLAGVALVLALGAPTVLGPRRRSVPDLMAGTTVVRWDRDAHEPVDPRAQRKRPRMLGMISGLARPGRDAEDWVVPDEPVAGRTAPARRGTTVTGRRSALPHGPAQRRPS